MTSCRILGCGVKSGTPDTISCRIFHFRIKSGTSTAGFFAWRDYPAIALPVYSMYEVLICCECDFSVFGCRIFSFYREFGTRPCQRCRILFVVSEFGSVVCKGLENLR